MRPLVIYHDKCTDGFGAAFAAWMKLGEEADYLPMSYGEGDWAEGDEPAVEALVQGREVLILDFSFCKPIMDKVFQSAHRVVWLDHHKTAFEMWCGEYKKGMIYSGSPYSPHLITLDDNRSGALLAWEHFHLGVEIPMLIRHIDDRDRWQFKLEGSKELHVGLSSLRPWSFEQWRPLLNLPLLSLIKTDGRAILAAQDSNVKSMAKLARGCCIWKHCGDPYDERNSLEVHGLAVNASLHQSELGHELADSSGTFGLVWYLPQSGDEAHCSIRSNGEYDVSEIAKHFGGGGHRNAAGFKVPMFVLMGWIK